MHKVTMTGVWRRQSGLEVEEVEVEVEGEVEVGAEVEEEEEWEDVGGPRRRAPLYC